MKIISLGHSCNVAFQIRTHTGDNQSHFFDWLATPQEGLLSILRNNFDVFRPENLKITSKRGIKCITDTKTNINFYHQFPLIGNEPIEEFLSYYPIFKAKFDYLALKFKNEVQHNPVCLIRSLTQKSKAIEIEQAFFSTFPNAKAKFLYVNEGNQAELFKTGNGQSVHIPSNGLRFGSTSKWAQVFKDLGLINIGYQLTNAQIFSKNHQDDFSLYSNPPYTQEDLFEAIQINPLNIEWHIEILEHYLNNHEWEASFIIFNKLKHEIIKSVELSILYEFYIIKTQNTSLGLKYNSFEKEKLGVVPSNILLKFLDVLIYKSQYDLAIQTCEILLDRNAYNHFIYNKKSLFLLKINKLIESLACSEIATSLCNNPIYYALKSDILIKLKRESEALESLESAIKFGGGNTIINSYKKLHTKIYKHE